MYKRGKNSPNNGQIFGKFAELWNQEFVKATLYLDRRSRKIDGTYPLYVTFTFKGDTVRIRLGVDIREDEWNEETKQVINRSDAFLMNQFLTNKLTAVQHAILDLQFSPFWGKAKRGKDMKQLLLNYLEGKDLQSGEVTFPMIFEQFAESRAKERTREIYRETQKKLKEYVGEGAWELIQYSDITPQWLRKFEAYLRTKKGLSTNTIAIELRNIRAVFNHAIDEELTQHYPFRKYSIKRERTRKRSLSVEELRAYFNADVTEDQRLHLDIFKLIFFLIGINVADLSQLTEIHNGRIEYKREKTGKLYSIKVEPEAMEIIERYRGQEKLLDVFERYKDHRHFATRSNKMLKKIGDTKIGKQGRRTYNPLQPEISIYWARHTWATLAARLDVPKETIAKALGHGTETVTDVYIDFDERKIDEANRRVIDFVLYNKE